MKFEFTPEEAIRCAEIMIGYLTRTGMRVQVEKAAWPSAPFRTTLFALKQGLHILVEAQGLPAYSRSLRELLSWLAKNRHYAELYIATYSDSTIRTGMMQEMKADGVGLYVIDDSDDVSLQIPAKNQALLVTPDPTLRYGRYRQAVVQAIAKFNNANRKDGLRDLCEIVEKTTEDLGSAACRKGWLKIPFDQFKKKNWEGQINELARNEAYNAQYQPIISTNLKNDLLSFKGARNLISHKVQSASANREREKQFAERMVQGPRLVDNLSKAAKMIK